MRRVVAAAAPHLGMVAQALVVQVFTQAQQVFPLVMVSRALVQVAAALAETAQLQEQQATAAMVWSS
jgi:hypothetical protein